MDIVDVTEIARRAGTTAGTIHSWRNRHADFPAPLVTLAIGPIWKWEPVRYWLARRFPTWKADQPPVLRRK